jgi:predicted nucleic acid-binding protein
VIVFLDTNYVIYLIEQSPVRGAKALARFQVLHAANDQLVVSDLVRLECRVGPLKQEDVTLLAQYDAFFSPSDLLVAPLSPSVCDRAALIRADHGLTIPDAWNLAAAIESGCSVFLTNDARLGRFPGITVEVLI